MCVVLSKRQLSSTQSSGMKSSQYRTSQASALMLRVASHQSALRHMGKVWHLFGDVNSNFVKYSKPLSLEPNGILACLLATSLRLLKAQDSYQISWKYRVHILLHRLPTAGETESAEHKKPSIRRTNTLVCCLKSRDMSGDRRNQTRLRHW